jgi:hypothetical protein
MRTIGKIQGDLKKRKVNTPKTRTIILENLVFKELRNNGHLAKFSQYINSKQVKELSL